MTGRPCSADALPDLAETIAPRNAATGRRLDYLEALLAARLQNWSWRTPAGGSALWIELGGTDAAAFAQVALSHGVEVVPAAAMDPSGAHDMHIRLPFTFAEDVLTELVGRLERAWVGPRRHGPAGPPTRHAVA